MKLVTREQEFALLEQDVISIPLSPMGRLGDDRVELALFA